MTLVGDRGMIKSGQIKDLQKHGFHYITAITKVQIETLIKKNIIKYNSFDDILYERTCARGDVGLYNYP
jgi:hypothetical protein